MIKLILYIIFLTSYSCAQKTVITSEAEMKRRDMSDYYSGTGVVRYLLPSIPQWANTSHSGKCHRKESITLLDYKKLRKSYFLDYEQAVQFQLMFNQMLRKTEVDYQVSYVTFKKEEEVFYEVSDRIQSKFRVFRSPKLSRVHIVWVDHAIDDKKVLKRLKNLFKTKVMEEGHPIFLSMCLRREELMNFVQENGLPESARYISYEMFSPFMANGLRSYGELIDIDKLLKKDYKKYFYSSDQLPFEVRGKMILKKY